MATKRIRPALLAAAVLLAACGMQVMPEAQVVVDGVPSGGCIADPTLGPDPFLLCPVAVDLAVSKLIVLPGTVQAVEFHRGVLCPPNARCRQLTDRGTVVFWFVDAQPLIVPVTHEGPAGFVAGEPQAPPEWLLDEGPGAGMPAN